LTLKNQWLGKRETPPYPDNSLTPL
jgi:hypothetical protein